MEITVQKYGGSSVASSEKILRIAEKIAGKVKAGGKVILVVSAMGKSTDNLIRLAREVASTPDPRELDMLLTTGEQVSASLVAMALQSKGIKSKSLNGFQAGIKTTARYNEAKIVSFDKKKIIDMMQELDALVVTGFQGITEEGEVTTLGRGGSDTSAVALAAALGVDCEIYSDVAGIYTVDPRLHPNAKKIKYISYDEMLEMASLGAKVLHSRSVEIAKKFGIKIYCGSTFSDEEGSFVADENIIIEQPVVTGCSLMENQTQVFIKHLPVDYSLVRRIFEKVATEGLNVDMISIINSESDLVVSFTIVESKKKHLQAALSKVLSDLKDWNVEYHTGYVKVSIVGIGMRSGIGVASSFFKALQNVPIKLVTTSEIAISCLIAEQYKNSAVEALVKEFNL
ncbi:MAG: aspartate kinase [Ignavibacteria bacterium]|nr:aspartate kinase [Ignavibacteria bacterium]MCU7503888.1 aspartate kinase [Ignavibacteria bacterium]MCU7515891.1 aspartate kinase [Ignavibacteria bacterium]